MATALINSYTSELPLNSSDSIIPACIQELDFKKLKFKLSQSKESKFSVEVCDFAEIEYKKFLTLKLLNPETALVPNQVVDEFWHAHVLDTKSYHEDCQKVFGHYLHHYPYFGIFSDEDYSELENTFTKTKQLYEMWFGAHPEYLTATRCGDDHACHAPSSCACRVPSACK